MQSLQAVNVSCVRRDRVLFDNLCVEMSPGTLIYLTGQNGAGKTSLLRILVGFVLPASGEVRYNGLDINDSQARRALNRDLVYVGHKSALDPHASAVENSRFWCAQQGIDVSDDAIYSTLTQLGLVGLEELPCGQLSAGQNRRVALARLWFKDNAKIWILDEPFTALDVAGIALVERTIESFLRKGGSVLMTSHQALSHLQEWHSVELEYRL